MNETRLVNNRTFAQVHAALRDLKPGTYRFQVQSGAASCDLLPHCAPDND
jgi:hypothetical protein